MEQVVSALRAKLATISAGTKDDFLAGFGPIHRRWHMAEMDSGVGTYRGKPIGFLSFHHEVLAVYRDRLAPRLTAGRMAHPAPPYRPSIDTQPDILSFSPALEDWHNGVHRNTAKYGADFADPMKNIHLTRFWQFHAFIDARFQAYLHNAGITYDDLDHTQT